MKMDVKVTLLILVLVGVAASYPQAASFGNGVASASFGGYHASAGLGGLAGGSGAGGGLFAQAGLPDGTGAGAGLGGRTAGGAAGGLYAGAGVAGGPTASAGLGGQAAGGAAQGGLYGGGTGVYKTGGGGYYVSKSRGATVKPGVQVGQTQTTFFNDIFNIPTSALQAVNQFLNNNVNTRGAAIRAHKTAHFNFNVNAGAAGCANTPEGCAVTKTKTVVVAPAAAKLDANVHLNARAGCNGPDGCDVVKETPVVTKNEVASVSSSAVGSASGTTVVQNKNFDGIFNIPITVLKSVNQLLNNLG